MNSPADEKTRLRLRTRMLAFNSARRRLIAELVSECRDCAKPSEVRRKVASRLDEITETRNVRFGVIEIMAIVQLVIAIWRFIDSMGWLEDATPDGVEELFDGA